MNAGAAAEAAALVRSTAFSRLNHPEPGENERETRSVSDAANEAPSPRKVRAMGCGLTRRPFELILLNIPANSRVWLRN